MKRCRHDASLDRGVAVHEQSRGLFIRRLEDDDAKGLVKRFGRASGQDHLARLGRLAQPIEVQAEDGILFLGPRGGFVEPARDTQDVDELRRLGGGLRACLRLGGGQCRGERADERSSCRSAHPRFLQRYAGDSATRASEIIAQFEAGRAGSRVSGGTEADRQVAGSLRVIERAKEPADDALRLRDAGIVQTLAEDHAANPRGRRGGFAGGTGPGGRVQNGAL